jgi:hypothetical protein
MRFAAIVNLPVIILALVVGAAALPRTPSLANRDGPYKMDIGPSHFFFFSSAFNILLLD